jgi:purine-nucleoside phosphorylase
VSDSIPSIHPQARVQQSYLWLLGRGWDRIDVAIILGSGLGGLEYELEGFDIIPYADIPGFPLSSVAGHAGQLGIGYVEGKKTMIFSGRFHFYEGHSMQVSTYPVQLAARCGVSTLIITNAAGGINFDYRVGDFMHITGALGVISADMHIPVSVVNGLRFDDHHQKVLAASQKSGIPVHQGTYMYVSGPSYETPAEIRSFRLMGADAVGMSTVPELMESSRWNVSTIGISLITNAASGIEDTVLDHADIKEIGKKRADDFKKLVMALIAEC